MENKSYYEKIEEQLKKREFDKKGFIDDIDFSKPIEKDSDSKIIGSILKMREMIEEGVLKDNKRSEELSEEEISRLKEILNEIYNKILIELHEYCDLREEYYHLVATWIIGTYFHTSFDTFPYLFVNAMRGSGKTRLLKLISSLAKNGELIASPTEAVLFRIPPETTVCIDEFEGVTRKGNEGLREMLNACYKKGMKVRRMKKKRTEEGSEMVVEEFMPYKPICLANIWGMEEVLGDRCITTILEKSTRPDVMRIMEDFDEKPTIKFIKAGINANLVQLCSFFGVVRYKNKWNLYVKSKYTTLYTLNTLTTQTTQTTPPNLDQKNLVTTEFEDFLPLFNKIDETGINGRNLELFFPLLVIGDFISEEIFNKILKVAQDLTKEKREEEMVESRDVALFDFVSQQDMNREFKTIKWITNNFRNYLGDDQEDERWINTKWIGRALKRLGLILDKRRVKEGMEVTLDVDKAKEKIKFLKG